MTPAVRILVDFIIDRVHEIPRGVAVLGIVENHVEFGRGTEHVAQAPKREAASVVLFEPDLDTQPVDPRCELIGRQGVDVFRAKEVDEQLIEIHHASVSEMPRNPKMSRTATSGRAHDVHIPRRDHADGGHQMFRILTQPRTSTMTAPWTDGPISFPGEPTQSSRGVEADMRTKPDDGEESWMGKGVLTDRVAPITGGDSGIASGEGSHISGALIAVTGGTPIL